MFSSTFIPKINTKQSEIYDVKVTDNSAWLMKKTDHARRAFLTDLKL